MPFQPFSGPPPRLPSLRDFPGATNGRVMPKRHPRSQANVAPPELMAALAMSDVGSAWKRQRSKFYHSVEWRNLRNATRLKNAGACQRCNGNCPSTGHCHHIAPLRTNWELRLDPANVMWLCPTCHRFMHGIP